MQHPHLSPAPHVMQVIFKGALSEDEIMDELDTRDAEHREKKKKRKSSGPRGFKVRSRKKAGGGAAAGAKRKTIGTEGVLDGVFQRCGAISPPLSLFTRAVLVLLPLLLLLPVAAASPCSNSNHAWSDRWRPHVIM